MTAADSGREAGAAETLEQEQQSFEAQDQVTEESVEQAEGNEAISGQQEETARLQKLADENYQRYLRTQADFDNFRRRSRQEKEEFAKYASQKLIEQLLPVYDNFERAMKATKEGGDIESLLKGVEMIYRQLEQVLDAEGVKPVDTVGKPFDPAVHQAVMQVETDEFEPGTVVEELQKGYTLKDKVIRPAMVKVSG